MQNTVTNPKINYTETLGDVLSNAIKTANERIDRLRSEPHSPKAAIKFGQAVEIRDRLNQKWEDYINSIAD